VNTTITICDTCKRDDWAEKGVEITDGEALAALIEQAAKVVDGVKTRRHSCLMGCGKGCNLAIQAQGKLTYVMGDFDAQEESAEGVVEYARLHSASETGQVPFKQWPQAVKGHFVSRLPVLNPDQE
jgi:predicted metal-binding protein